MTAVVRYLKFAFPKPQYKVTGVSWPRVNVNTNSSWKRDLPKVVKQCLSQKEQKGKIVFVPTRVNKCLSREGWTSVSRKGWTSVCPNSQQEQKGTTVFVPTGAKGWTSVPRRVNKCLSQQPTGAKGEQVLVPTRVNKYPKNDEQVFVPTRVNKCLSQQPTGAKG